jgi:uncharacterized repeat protein (TIGR03803 family)
LATDPAGNLYAATWYGGSNNDGAVVKLNRTHGGWTLQPLYSFAGGEDGKIGAGVVLASDGSLYGATVSGGGFFNCGIVYRLQPPPTFPRTPLTPWNETVVYRFLGSTGCAPYAPPILDTAGNLYGTTSYGGGHNEGAVYELVRSDGSYAEQVLHSFLEGNDGYLPVSGLTADNAFNLYGTTINGGYGYGTVFKLTNTGSGWTESVLYSFSALDDGADPATGLALDGSGNLYGTTLTGGGTVFKLTSFGGGYTFNLLYNFACCGDGGPYYGQLTVDAAGNVYGTTSGDGAYGHGSVFELSPSGSVYTYTDLYDFTGGVDGDHPWGGVILDSSGNLFGTATQGGSGGFGVIFEITP